MKQMPLRRLFVLACLSSSFLFFSSCRKSDGETASPPLTPYAPLDLDSSRAYQEVEQLVALGARDAGTEGAHQAALHLKERLEGVGVPATIETFNDKTPHGVLGFHNVEGRLDGNHETIIILGSHYDTKSGISSDFQGANDSGSSSGLLLELARVLREHHARHSGVYPEFRFVFFDGEECSVKYGPHDGFHGSRHYAQALVDQGKADKVMAVIILDMIGDRDLSITLPRNSTPFLLKTALQAANEENARDKISLFRGIIGDDHVAFLERGMPAIDLIDFHFGSKPGLNDYWHTPEDTMEKISPESLGLVGRVVLRMLNHLVVEDRGL